jgi:hypothetical protein
VSAFIALPDLISEIPPVKASAERSSGDGIAHNQPEKNDLLSRQQHRLPIQAD